MKSVVFIAVIIISTHILNSCKDNPVPTEEQPQINLTLKDASCTEAWIKLNTVNLALPTDVDLYKDSSLAESINLTSSDTILYIDSLLPNQSYSFRSVIQSINQSSNLLDITTMDTTSHNFTWQAWTFGGQAGSCALYDVAIINENDIWAVGEIYLLDSLGQYDPNAYNAVHWDGNQWELKRIEYFGSCSVVRFPPLKAVWAFSAIKIVVTNGGSIGWFNGNTVSLDCRVNPLLTGAINKIWGSSSIDFYVAGNSGSVAHYQNGQWSRIESGTDLDILDIYGDYDDQTDSYEILAVASDYPSGIEKAILSISNDKAKQVSTVPIMWPLFTIWFIPNRKYYSAGSGIYQKHLIQDSTWKNKVLDITTFTITSIRGNNINDVAAVGAFGDLVHYNGISWKNNYEEPLLSNGSYTRVTMKGDLLVAVGGNYTSINSEAVILIGRR